MEKWSTFIPAISNSSLYSLSLNKDLDTTLIYAVFRVLVIFGPQQGKPCYTLADSEFLAQKVGYLKLEIRHWS